MAQGGPKNETMTEESGMQKKKLLMQQEKCQHFANYESDTDCLFPMVQV